MLTDQIRLWRAISKFGPDIVHLNPSLDFKSFLRDALFLILAHLRKRKTVVFFRGWEIPFEASVSGYLRPLFNLTYRRSDAFIVLGNYFGDRLREWDIRAPIFVGTTAVPDTLLENFSIETKMGEVAANQRIKVLYLARLERDKGVVELAQAAGELIQSGAPLTLTIAGVGSAEDELRTMVNKFTDVGEQINLIGYVRGDEKSAVFREHQIFCFPTQYGEGMPNALLEAMAFGLSVVTCPVGGVADFFEDGKMGVLIDKPDVVVIKDALQKLINNNQEIEQNGRYNHHYATQHFLASKAAIFLGETYTEIGQAK